MNIRGAIAFGTEKLAASAIPDPSRDAVHLLMFAAGVDRVFTIANPEYELSTQAETAFCSAIARRSALEPFQYIVSSQAFYGLEFKVTPAVLIPRPETEIAVARVIELLKPRRTSEFLDIGTGSGCITIAALKNLPDSRATAVDISDDALAVAGENAGTHGLTERIEFIRSDVYAQVPEGKNFDLIISNPPYVAAADIAELQAEVRDHEPHVALTDRSSGVTIIKRIIDGAPHYLADDGWLVLEIGAGQADEVCEMFDPQCWADITIEPDLQQIPRVVSARLLPQNASSR